MSVDLAELIKKGGVFKDIEGSSPEEIYKNVISKINFSSDINPEIIYKALCDREKIMSTAVGKGIALPHARVPVIKDEKDQRICVVYLKKPIDMHAPDGCLVFVMFVILTSNQQTHLKVLSELVQLFQNQDFKQLLESHTDEPLLVKAIKKLI